MKNHTLFLTAVAVAGVLQACSNNNGPSAADNTMKTDTTTVRASATPEASTAMADTAFANKAAMGGMAEVALGKMAADKSTDTNVKDFGDLMVKDHGKANDELASIAKSENIQLPTSLDAKHQALSDSLSKLSGKAFDKAYVNAMLEGHKQTLALLQDEAANGKDPQLKAFAVNTATVVQGHLDKIEKIHDGMK